MPVALIGCGPSAGPAAPGGGPGLPDEDGDVVRQTPESGHLWDTEDPRAAEAPRGLLTFVLLVSASVVLWRVGRRRRTRRRFRLSAARATQIVVRHHASSGPTPAGDGHAVATQFPAWISDEGLVRTIEHIANDPAAYASGVLPAAPGLYVAQVHIPGPDEEDVVVKVVVDGADGDVLAAHPSLPPATEEGDVAPGSSPDRSGREVRDLLEQACAALPPDAVAYATRSPHHPDSIGTLAYARELLDQDEREVALYAIAEIAHAVPAGAACWAALRDAAGAMRFDARQRERACLRCEVSSRG